MMRKLISLGAALVLLTTLGLVVAAAQTSADDRSHDKEHVINLISKAGPEADLDLGDKGFSLGDQVVFSDTLFRHGQQVGRSGGSCQIVQATTEDAPVTVNCTVTLELKDGQITAQVLVTFSQVDAPFYAAITGGTGAYKAARGQVRVSTVDETTQRLRVELIL